MTHASRQVEAPSASPRSASASNAGISANQNLLTSWKLCERQAARDYYDRAVARMNATYPKSPRLLVVKEEAASVLSLTE